MDDIIIPSQTIEENLEKLSLVLNLAAKHGLNINWQKCQFIKTKITFLGYIFENSTIQPSLEKREAVTKYPVPRDLKTLQRFVGLTSYFRRFIQNYSSIAKPLTDMLSPKSKFQINDEANIAFQQLKSALTNAPVLKIFNQNAPTEIHTDASKYGFGATLLQKDSEDGKWHPIEYFSKKTSLVEQKYHSYELEVLAVISALKKWRCYILGMHIKIVTDCNAFTQTIKKQDVPLRVQRWIMFLQDFDFEIEHRNGSKLKHVDALSRVYCLVIQNSLKHRIINAQDDDIWVKNLKELVKSKKHPEFFIKNDILYKDYNNELIVIPSAMENEIIEMAHKQGHVSAKKTIDIVNKNFFIKNITEKATRIVKNCIQCLISGAKTGKKEGFLNPIDKANQPLDTYHIDHVGPLEKTNKQYNHILTIVDAFSKFTWIYPTKSTGTDEVIEILRKQSAIFGNPNRIISDKGTAFTSQKFQDYCLNENIKHNVTTTGVPRGNGQVERIHKIVLSLLTKLCVDSPQKWYKHLNNIQQTINSTKSRSTQETPFKILTGLDMKTNNLNIIQNLLTEEEINTLQENRDLIREQAKENILKIQQENKKTFNKNRKKEIEYNERDVVVIKRTHFGNNLKIKPKFLGPYRVIKKKRFGRYDVEKLGEEEGPKLTSTVAENMKKWQNQ